MKSGTAVSASEKLWIVSASSATDPVATITTTCAGAPLKTFSARNEILTAREALLTASSAVSMLSAGSWLVNG